jgi:hypothetical protein
MRVQDIVCGIEDRKRWRIRLEFIQPRLDLEAALKLGRLTRQSVKSSTRNLCFFMLRHIAGERLGFQFVANNRSIHFVEDWPGAVGQALQDDGPHYGI